MRYLYVFTVTVILLILLVLYSCNDNNAKRVFSEVDMEGKFSGKKIQEIIRRQNPPVPEYKLPDEYTLLEVCVHGISHREQILRIMRYPVCPTTIKTSVVCNGCGACEDCTVNTDCTSQPDQGNSTLWVETSKDKKIIICATFVASRGDVFRLINIADKEYTKLKKQHWFVNRIIPGRTKYGKSIGGKSVLIDNDGRIIPESKPKKYKLRK